MSSPIAAAARALLPWWVGWGSLLQPLLAGLVTFLFSSLVWRILLRPLARFPPEAPWTERARLVYAAVRAATTAGWILSLAFAVGALVGWTGPLSRLSPWLVALLAFVVCRVAVAEAARRARSRAGLAPLPSRKYWRGVVAQGLLVSFWVYASAGVVLAAVRLEPAVIAAIGSIGFLVFAMAAMAGAGVALARTVGLARPASARLHAALDQAAAQTGTRPRAAYEVDLRQANAFAFPLSQRVCVTEPLLAHLDDDELRAVLAHELGHLAERIWPRLAILLAVPLAIVAYAFVVPRFGPFKSLAALLVFLLLFRRVLARFARRKEQQADRVATAGHAPSPAYARALEKLYRANLVPAVIGRTSQRHPDLYDRMVAAGVTPPYPRPLPPPRRGPRLMTLGALAVAALALAQSLLQPRPTPVSLASDLFVQGDQLARAGDSTAAAKFDAAAAQLTRRTPTTQQWGH